MVFQDYALFPHLTVFENVAFGLHRLEKSERIPRAMELLGLVGLAGAKKNTRMSYPAVNSSVSPSHVRWRQNPICCCWMNPFRTSIAICVSVCRRKSVKC